MRFTSNLAVRKIKFNTNKLKENHDVNACMFVISGLKSEACSHKYDHHKQDNFAPNVTGSLSQNDSAYIIDVIRNGDSNYGC